MLSLALARSCSSPLPPLAAPPAERLMMLLHAVQVLLLLLILRVLNKIYDAVKPGPTRARPAAEAADAKPTIATLEPENGKVQGGGFRPPAEWTPLSSAELDVLQKVRDWLDADGSRTWEKVPYDLRVGFVRGFQYRADWERATCAFLDGALEYRRESGIGEAVASASAAERVVPKRTLFERLMPGGLVGADANGRPVVLDRLPSCTPAELLDHFDEAALIRHTAYTNECIRAQCLAASWSRKTRVQKAVRVLDVGGLTLAHTDRKMVAIAQTLNGFLAFKYPESVARIYVINAPMIFSMAFAVVRTFLHPITAEKFCVCSSNYAKQFAADGIVLDGGATEVPQQIPSWGAHMARLREELPAELLKMGFLPPEDAEAMKARRLL